MNQCTVYRRLLRVEQWYKNLVALVPLLFASPNLLYSAHELALAIIGFCCLSSISYILNDWRDREQDRLHPTKKERPLASGLVSGMQALCVSSILGMIVLVAMYTLGSFYTFILITYLVVSTLYSLGLKNIPLVDMLIITSNFLLRTLAGVRHIPKDAWLYFFVVGLIIIIFLSHKRRSDNKLLGKEALQHKPVLQFYTRSWCYGIRVACYSLLAIASVLLWTQEKVHISSVLLVYGTLVTISFLFSRTPKLVLKPHYLFRIWYIDILILLCIGSFLVT